MNLLALQSMTQLGTDTLQAVRDAEYDGVQFVQPLDRALRDDALALGLAVCGSGRVRIARECFEEAARSYPGQDGGNE